MSQNIRQESIRLIAHSLKSRDESRAFHIQFQGSGRLKVTAQAGSEAAYLEDAERLLDTEIVRMAEERIMNRIRNNS